MIFFEKILNTTNGLKNRELGVFVPKEKKFYST